jgi:hypothetical protein
LLDGYELAVCGGYDLGCVGLISSGGSGQESVFLDASETGVDVFFMTTAKLVPQDTDTQYDIYDARIDGGFPALMSPLVCTSTGCQGIPESRPGIFGAPASATFNGVGNLTAPAPAIVKPKPKAKVLTRAQKLAAALKACKKDMREKKRVNCEKRARREYGAERKRTRA